MARWWITLVLLSAGAVACERTGPCVAYDRMAEARKGNALIRYCVGRRGMAQGPYTCVLDNDAGSVAGTYRDAKRNGRWVYRADGGAVVRTEVWRDDKRVDVQELEPALPPLPEDVTRVSCDGHTLRRAPKQAGARRPTGLGGEQN